jgi:hypothetical protein
MSDFEDVWRGRTDDAVIEAMASLPDFNADAQAVIRAEHARRGLPPPFVATASPEVVDRVARAHRLFLMFVAVQWITVLCVGVVWEGPPSPWKSLAQLAWILGMLFTTFAVPVAGWTLLQRLDVTPALAVVTAVAPLSLLFVCILPYFATPWAKRNGVTVGLLGPSRSPS